MISINKDYQYNYKTAQQMFNKKKYKSYTSLLKGAFVLILLSNYSLSFSQLNKKILATDYTVSYNSLKAGFLNPPNESRLRCYWWWLNSMVTKESITRDLKQMKAKGYGGASIVDAGNSYSTLTTKLKAGPVFMSPQWMELYKHAVKEAQRLDIELSVNVQSGWNPGGPSITPEYALKKIVTADTTITGGKLIRMNLPIPDTDLMYRDIVIQAIPKPDKDLPIKDKAITNWSEKSFNRELGWSGIYPLYKLRDGFFDSTPVNIVQRKNIINLNQYFDGKTLKWNAPPGDWIITRYGWTCTGVTTSTTSDGWGGLSLDHINPDAFKLFSNTVIIPLIKAAQSVGNSIHFLQTDSWEMGNISWTQNFLNDFKQMRGYDMMPYLPVLAGRVVGSQEISNRFLYDFRKTIGECVQKYHYQLFADLAHQYGLGIHPESGGPHSAPVDALKVMGVSDFPQGEFWAMSNTHRVNDADRLSIMQSACVAHTNGKRFVAAEGPTSIGPHWQESPFELKNNIDRVFCSGVNRIVWHTFTSSPKEFGIPGNEYFAGTHLNPNVTWWNDAGAFISYLDRCSFMLQQGLFTADVLYYYGDDVPNFVFLKEEFPELKFGYNWDKCSSEILDKIVVKNGKLVLPDGMSYRILVLPPEKTISLDVLKRIEELAKAGAIVYGPKPERATGLLNYPECDTELKALADTLWGNIDGKTITENKYGKGKIVWGIDINKQLNDMNVAPDFSYSSNSGTAKLDYLHRRTESSDIYFIANKFMWKNYSDYTYRYLPEEMPDRHEHVKCRFRVTDKKPQLWNPLTGAISDIVNYRIESGQTIIPLYLQPGQSVFIVFNGEIKKADQIVSIAKNGNQIISSEKPVDTSSMPPIELQKNNSSLQATIYKPGKYTLTNAYGKHAVVESQKPLYTQQISGPWKLKFEGPNQNVSDTNINQLKSWTDFSNSDIKYFSGKVIYQTTFHIDKIEQRKYILDLGNVQDLATVELNGKNLGVLWTAPFSIDVSSAIKPGNNILKIGVTNLWMNRLVGDSKLEKSKRHTHTDVIKFDVPDSEKYLRRSGLLGPVKIIGAPILGMKFK
ncbi:MAG: glycosyl hydrolase [Arachidicoccus sp.]|nr:glycosyl hydrolase [Arachidicoccus sp.]